MSAEVYEAGLPPTLALTAGEAERLFSALRRYRYSNVTFSEPGPTNGELQDLLYQVMQYWLRRRQWETEFFPADDELPF